ncbi:MAG TPA: class I SAM-dependent methyltransferase [Thermoleophilaceae bacterium]
MPDWQERITHDTEPTIRVEHQLRYLLAAPLVHASRFWCDLGCGTGVGAAHGLGGRVAEQTLLVDIAADVLEQARRELPGENIATMEADLASEQDVARVAAAIKEQAGDGTAAVTCFECIEHLASFVPLVAALVELAERHGVTVLLSVPNDAFWSVENPHHQTVWGEGAFDELVALLPDERVLLRQVVLQGSAVVRDDSEPELRPVPIGLEPNGVPSHMLVAFGPRREELAPSAAVAQVDMEEQRRWQRQREADLSRLREIIQLNDEYREYIRELEERAADAKKRT